MCVRVSVFDLVCVCVCECARARARVCVCVCVLRVTTGVLVDFSNITAFNSAPATK